MGFEIFYFFRFFYTITHIKIRIITLDWEICFIRLNLVLRLPEVR